MRTSIPKPLSYAQTVRFHGHDGPFLALGYRLGTLLLEELRPDSIMDLKLTVRSRIKKPYTCILDGLQCSTFATLGKGNISVVECCGDNIVVEAQKRNRTLKFCMGPYAWNICLHADDLRKASRSIRRAPMDKIWLRKK